MFDQRGDVEVAITLTGFASGLPTPQIQRLGQRLRDTAIVSTCANNGVIPLDSP